MGSHQRKYRVIGLTENGASTQTFPFERAGNKIDMTVQHYFEKELNVRLRYNYVFLCWKILFVLGLMCLFDVLVLGFYRSAVTVYFISCTFLRKYQNVSIIKRFYNFLVIVFKWVQSDINEKSKRTQGRCSNGVYPFQSWFT